MQLITEISLHPISDQGLPLIQEFIDRINSHTDIVVQTNDLSTLIKGDYDQVMDLLKKEIFMSFQKDVKMVFVLKLHAP